MRTIDVAALLNGARLNSFHARLLFWSALIIVFDGYDLVIYGVVLPALMKDWGLTALQAGLLATCAVLGMMVGAVVLGSLSDRIGRRKAITLCVVLFSGMTAINGFARTPEEFALCRFLAGLGIGGVMPNITALMNEYAPKRLRSRLIALMFTGYAIGGILSAALGMLLIPTWGWSSVFFVAAVPLLVLPLLVRQLPESINFLLRKDQKKLAQELLQRAEPSYTPRPDDKFCLEAGQAQKVSFVQIFQDGRLINTLLLWLAFCCSMLMIYGISAWLPKLMNTAGYGLTSSIGFLLVLNAGGILGALSGGWMADRFGLGRILMCFLAISSMVLGLMAVKAPLPLLYTLIAITGGGTYGAQILANVLAVQYYPAHIRSTGLGWAMAIGRIGAIIGPMVGAVIHGAGLPMEVSFLAFAIPGVIGATAIGVFMIRVNRRLRSQSINTLPPTSVSSLDVSG